GDGGFPVVVYILGALVIRFSFPSGGDELMSPYVPAPLSLVGALMMLFGVGEWGRWAYLWVFVSTPLVVSLYSLLAWRDWGGNDVIFLIFTLPLVLSYFLVRRYYRSREARNAAAVDQVSSAAKT